MRLKTTLLSLSLLAVLAACDNNTSENYESETSRSMLSSRSPFIPTNKELKANSAKDEMNTMLACEEPTTSTRLDKETYSVMYSLISRGRYSFDITEKPKTSSVEHWVGYSTENMGKTYTISYKLNDLIRNNQKTSPTELYGYNFACTASKGCESDKKTYTSGSVWNKIELKNSTSLNAGYASCSFEIDEDAERIEPTIQQGRIDIGSKAYNAVKFNSKKNGNIRCSDELVGKGTVTSVTIVIADELPQLEKINYELRDIENIPNDFNSSYHSNCSRTVVFQGEEIRFGDQVISGSSLEMAGFEVSGEIKTVEEWEKAKIDIANQRRKLQQIVANAKSNMEQSKADYDRAVLSKENAETDHQVKVAEMNQAQNTYDADPTEENLQALQKARQAERDAKDLIEKRQDAELAAKKVYDSDKNVYDSAVIDLKTFNEQNPINSED